MSCISVTPLNRMHLSHPPTNSYRHFPTTHRRTSIWRCQASNEDPNGDLKSADKSTKAVDMVVPDKQINRRIGLVSVSAAVALFLSRRGWFGGVVSLGDLAATAISYDEALMNGMPTMVEFYADWCEVCRELAPDVYKVEQEFKGLIHPNIPQMAILGYPESLSTLHSSEIRCQWLAYLLSGKFVLPFIKDMEEYTDEMDKYMKRITQFYWKSCHATFQIWDNDNVETWDGTQ